MSKDPNARYDAILDLIVRSYIDTAEPMGSRTLSKLSDLGLSPATIRNVMQDLEEAGFLQQPHTSAGRVPTDKGYRYWVDTLMKPEELDAKEKHKISGELDRARTIEGLAERVCKVLSEMTGNAVLVYVKNLKRVSFLNQLLDDMIKADKLADFLQEEPELFIEGASRMLEQPEFQDLARMKALLHAFDAKASFLRALIHDMEDHNVHVRIGRENELGDLGVSLVAKDYYHSRTPIGGVAVVGPTRMKYPKVVSVVTYVADNVSRKMDKF